MRRALLALLLLLAALPAQAVDPLRLVSGFAPGGPTDQLARVMAPVLGQLLDRPVVIENRAGAGATIAAAAVARAAPDGNTLLIATSSFVITAATMANLPYDARRDFEPLYFLGEVQTLLVVAPTLGVTSMAELVAMARSGRQMNYASAGVGSTMHIAGELFNIAAGTPVAHVPYRGVPPAMAGMLAGNVHMMNADLPVLRPFVLDRRVVPLVVYSPRRSPQLPDVPSAAEVGMPQLDMSNWYGILAPAGTPQPVMRRLEAAFAAARVQPDVAPRFADGGVSEPMGADAFRAKLAAEFDRWVPLLQRAGIRAE
ncbi:tripartite tricarboxylate transporter substrate-binding protein [Falsiroseomonas sp. HW251]|uniref:tripartite tricarboxylate transporter substrate-binding protein n=1 Tax=Falsiroseomonas sp. HW251 TaxID=3390998 RepID=UPI003D3188EE